MNLRRRITDSSDRILTVIEVLGRDRRGWILLVVAFGWFLGIGMRLAVPVLIPFIRADFDFGLTAAGILLTFLWIVYALCQFPGGFLADRIGERNILVASTALVVLGLFVCAFASTVVLLFAGIALFGMGTGLFATTRFTVLSDVFPDHSATAIGFSSAFGNVGTILFPLVAGALAVAANWRASFGAVIPLFALATVGLWMVVPTQTSGDESAVDRLSWASASRVFDAITRPAPMAFALSLALMGVVYQGFTSFYPIYLATKGLSDGTATALYSLFFATGVVVQPVGGAIADRTSMSLTLTALSAFTAGALILLVAAGNLLSLLLITVLLGAQLGFWPIAQSATIDSLPTEMQGTGFGILRTSYLLVAAGSSTLIGSLGDRGLFDLAFLLLAGCALATALVGVLFSRRFGLD